MGAGKDAPSCLENSFKGQQILDLNRGHPTDILGVWAQQVLCAFKLWQVPSKSSKTKRAPKPKKDDVATPSAKETAKAEFLDKDNPITAAELRGSAAGIFKACVFFSSI